MEAAGVEAEDAGAPKEKPEEEGAVDPKENGLAAPAAGWAEVVPNEKAGFDAPESPEGVEVLPKEKEGADLPASSVFDGEVPKEKDGADEEAPSFSFVGDPDAPKLNDGEDDEEAPKLNPFEAGAGLDEPFAPPKGS